MTPLLEIRDLHVSFAAGNERWAILNGISLTIGRGRSLGIVGESGCGKSMTALSIMQLFQGTNLRIDGGEILYAREEGEAPIDILQYAQNSPQMRRLRGEEIAMIFQEPMTALDPVYSIGSQIAEMVQEHSDCSNKEAMDRAVELLRLVGVPSPEERVNQYPHEFSGGMRQRAVIAIALACNPSLLIADEPTTALDVTIQAQVLDLIKDLQQQFGSAILFITHDIGVIQQVADEVAVMYLGQIVEYGSVDDVVDNPAHPYTAGLIASVPTLETPRGQKVDPIQGVVPQMGAITSGCRFRTRCPHAMPVCAQDPPMLAAGDNHTASCWLLKDRS